MIHTKANKQAKAKKAKIHMKIHVQDKWHIVCTFLILTRTRSKQLFKHLQTQTTSVKILIYIILEFYYSG